MPRCEKFSKKFDLAFLSRNRTWEGVEPDGEEEEDALEWRRFWDGVDLRFGAIEQTNVRGREREGERQLEKYQAVFKNQMIKKEGTYAWKWTNMWHAKLNASWAQPNPNLPAHNIATK